jgi:Spy/CpxP family protein refolding chaperone
MSKKWFVIPAVVVIIVLVVGSAFAKRGYRHGRGLFGEFSIAQLEARLKLTPEQSQQVRDIISGQRSQMKERFGGGANTRQELIKELFRDNPNQAEIQKRVETLQQQHEQMLNQLVASGLELNKVFTPEQRAELQKALEEKAQVREKMRERMRQRWSEQQPETQSK